MNIHLESEELVDALEGALSEAHAAHLAGCHDCRDKVAELRDVMTDVECAVAVPEPSPLFWEHFSERVRTATASLEPASFAWWQGWRGLTTLGGVAAVLLLALTLKVGAPWPASREMTSVKAPRMAAISSTASDDASLNFVADLAATLPPDELQQVTQPTPDATDALVSQLSASERAELVRLLKLDKGRDE